MAVLLLGAAVLCLEDGCPVMGAIDDWYWTKMSVQNTMHQAK
tara:strand:- start:106115 stop:106240 length:126 start_codon:yes stop_codon:yes gene_type:complete